jgi:hypothetical protein
MTRSWSRDRRAGRVLLLALALLGVTARTALAQGIVRITIRPGPLDMAVGEVVQLQAEATFGDGSVANISEQVDWRTTNGGCRGSPPGRAAATR